uniref:Retinoic acid receptor responder protein 2 n=1 Tax=Xiphophorus couchianus TaxID=32473 RepID=A0A3B5LZF1_9TELE
MAAELLLLLLVCAGGLLLPAEAQDSYDQLPTVDKAGVDLALEQLLTNSGVKHHFRFLKSVEKNERDEGFGVRFLYHHFHLRPTRCAKGTAASDSRICPFRNDRPLMDCAVCYKTVDEQIETTPEPYVHCIQRPRLTEEMTTTRMNHWKKMTYKTGGATIMALSTG